MEESLTRPTGSLLLSKKGDSDQGPYRENRLEAVTELKRLWNLSTLMAWQLFTSIVSPMVDYASSVWMHEVKFRAIWAINRGQRIGPQATMGAVSIVATSVAKAEAHIATMQDRLWRRAIKLWTDMHTLPEQIRFAVLPHGCVRSSNDAHATPDRYVLRLVIWLSWPP